MHVSLNMHYIIYLFIKSKNQDNGTTKTKFGMVSLSSKQENRMFSEKVRKGIVLIMPCDSSLLFYCNKPFLNKFVEKKNVAKKYDNI